MSDNTVFIPQGGRSTRNGAFIPPLLLIPLIAYNFFAFLFMGGNPAGWSQQLLTIPMVSGSGWNIGSGDLILFLSLILLFFELLKSTSSQKVAIVNHALSMILFVSCLVAFLLIKGFATSTFFLILTMVMLDVLAGFIVTIISARKDLEFGAG